MLKEKVSSLGLNDNVVFTSFFERQEDLFQHIQKSRFALLPCKMDYISSTQRQAMHYQIPVVCYKTEGTETLNAEKECVLLAENSNVEDLAAKMLYMLDNKEKAEELRRNAKEYSVRWSDDEKNTKQMVDNFMAVIDNYRNGTPIPEKLLYKIAE
jgi:glycosyltransferase involved in cell wall biosynthesis